MKRLMLAAVAALSLAAPAVAEDIGFVATAPVKDKPTIALDPTRAYILLRSESAIPLRLMKDPSAQDQAEYDRMRAEAFAKARTKYEKQLARYESAKRAAAVARKKGGQVNIPDKPVEPTEANFEFTPFGLMAGVSIGPMNRFAKQDGGLSVYLQEVTPGSYRIYGPITIAGNGAIFGHCFCMGSVRFEAKAGEIADMGMVATSMPLPEGQERMVLQGFQLQPATAAMGVDARLSGMTVRPAAYRPAGKLPNYFGLAIDRLPAMPGVMRYDRDRIVDLTGGGDTASGR